MQVKNERKSNAARAEDTQHALVTAARRLFAEKGYPATSTPDIVSEAGVTRGALYHHYKDKAELFRTVLCKELTAIAEEIEARTSTDMEPMEALFAGSDAYFDAISAPGRAKMLLIDGPAALGFEEIRALGLETGGEELRQGLDHLFGDTNPNIDITILSDLFAAMFDRGALAISMGENSDQYKYHTKLIFSLLSNLVHTSHENKAID
ncbi:transcriptional regulator, TetR family [Cohaesibacter gelatinilyticus]|uniref:Transcriptional regulator, TetR family n=2 Tax=Cohaesibacter gelatinilyticus TaxID=372072 RepID=A0A285PDW7_9HYPH|nr:transcriptional regulator, TetR family [Cohaesibacter gelatinilyticus]